MSYERHGDGGAKDALAHDISRFDIVNFCDDEQEKPSDYL